MSVVRARTLLHGDHVALRQRPLRTWHKDAEGNRQIVYAEEPIYDSVMTVRVGGGTVVVTLDTGERFVLPADHWVEVADER